MLAKSNLFARRAITQFVRNSGHGGVPGENLPFSIENKYKITAYFALFFGSAFAAPFWVLRHQLLKK